MAEVYFDKDPKPQSGDQGGNKIEVDSKTYAGQPVTVVIEKGPKGEPGTVIEVKPKGR